MPDTYGFAIQPDAAPGGFIGQFAYNQTMSSLHNRGLISGSGLYNVSMSPLEALRNAGLHRLQAEMSAHDAAAQAEEWAEAAIGATRMAGREVTPELARAFRTMAGYSSSIGSPFMQRFAAGRALLDATAGGVSPLNIGHAITNQARYMRDPITGSRGLGMVQAQALSDGLSQHMKGAPTNQFGEPIGPTRNMGFSGRALGELIAINQAQGFGVNASLLTDLVSNSAVHRALARGDISFDTIDQIGRNRTLTEEFDRIGGFATDSASAQGGIGRGFRELTAMGIVSPDDLQAVQAEYRSMEEGMQGRRGATFNRMQNERRLANLAIGRHVMSRATGTPQGRTFDKPELREIQQFALEYMAIAAPDLALTTDMEVAKDWATALSALKANDYAAFEKTKFAKHERLEVAEHVKRVTGLAHQDFAEMAMTFDYRPEQLAAVVSQPKDFFGVNFTDANTPKAIDMSKEARVISDAFINRSRRKLEEQTRVLSAMRDIMGPRGVDGLIDSDEMMKLLNELDELTNHSRGQMSATQLEGKLRQFAVAKDRLGLNAAAVSQITQIGDAVASQYNLGATGRLAMATNLTTNLALFGNINDVEVFGMPTRDQAAQYLTMQQGAAMDSEYMHTVAAAIRLGRRHTTKFDGEQGTVVQQYLREVQTGELSPKMRAFEDREMRTGTLQATLAEAMGHDTLTLGTMSRDTIANRRVIDATNISLNNHRRIASEVLEQQVQPMMNQAAAETLGKRLGTDADDFGVLVGESMRELISEKPSLFGTGDIRSGSTAAQLVAGIMIEKLEGKTSGSRMAGVLAVAGLHDMRHMEDLVVHIAERMSSDQRVGKTLAELSIMYSDDAIKKRERMDIETSEQAKLESLLSGYRQDGDAAARFFGALQDAEAGKAMNLGLLLGKTLGMDFGDETGKQVLRAMNLVKLANEDMDEEGSQLRVLSQFKKNVEEDDVIHTFTKGRVRHQLDTLMADPAARDVFFKELQEVKHGRGGKLQTLVGEMLGHSASPEMQKRVETAIHDLVLDGEDVAGQTTEASETRKVVLSSLTKSLSGAYIADSQLTTTIVDAATNAGKRSTNDTTVIDEARRQDIGSFGGNHTLMLQNATINLNGTPAMTNATMEAPLPLGGYRAADTTQ